MDIQNKLLAEISTNIKSLQLQLDYERAKIITAIGGEPFLPDENFDYASGRLSVDAGFGFLGQSDAPQSSGSAFDLADIAKAWGNPCAFLIHIGVMSTNYQASNTWLLQSAWSATSLTDLGSCLYGGSAMVLTAAYQSSNVVRLSLTQNTGEASVLINVSVTPLKTYGLSSLAMII